VDKRSGDGRIPAKLKTNMGYVFVLPDSAETLNIGPSGIFLELELPLPKGTEIQLKVEIGGNAFETQAIVRWAQLNHGSDLPLGNGIEFLNMSAEFESAINEYIDGHKSIKS